MKIDEERLLPEAEQRSTCADTWVDSLCFGNIGALFDVFINFKPLKKTYHELCERI